MCQDWQDDPPQNSARVMVFSKVLVVEVVRASNKKGAGNTIPKGKWTEPEFLIQPPPQPLKNSHQCATQMQSSEVPQPHSTTPHLTPNDNSHHWMSLTYHEYGKSSVVAMKGIQPPGPSSPVEQKK